MYFAGIKATPATVGPEIFLPHVRLHVKATRKNHPRNYKGEV
jgi:hypothetical protein